MNKELASLIGDELIKIGNKFKTGTSQISEDPDGCEGFVFNRWIADMKWLGIAIPWNDFL